LEVWNFPLVDNYRVMFDYWVVKSGSDYKGSIDPIENTARVYGSQDKAMQTPNSDTPYSFAWLDLRAEPRPKYFYQDLDAGGQRLNGANRYAVTFAKNATPPVDGFWSLNRL
jgi:hypothetical protein